MKNDNNFDQFSGSHDYVTSEALRNAVNVAVALERPLLVRGEPGTGKTLLAHSIAKGLGERLIVWNIKSTTKAQDGLYIYDTVQRLNDSRFGGGDVSDIKKYIKSGKLGQAFVSPDRVVLLIDEIDKADIEFPNDLLNELDEMAFYIPETDETITAVHRPIGIITSNAEKELYH
jgi:MoxR-like ATPase